MGKIVALVGVFGGLLALFGSIVAMATGGVGMIAGADEAGSHAARSLAAIVASAVGVAGALAARRRLRFGAIVMIGSTAAGLALVTLFYATGAVLLLVASWMALRARPDDL